MIEKRIIPCLDMRDGKVVKGVNFEGIRDVGDPLELAKLYNNQGADELVIYDITASSKGKTAPFDIVKKVAQSVFVPLCVGGGISSIEDFQNALKAGADKVSINSQAIKTPELIKQAADNFGSQYVVVGIDAKRVSDGIFTVMSNGGMVDTKMDLIEWVKRVEELGAGEICLNSVDADGVKTGYDIEMLKAVCENISIPVIASGGCGKAEDFLEVFTKTKVSAALAASVFHFGELTVGKVKEYLRKEGIPVRE
jgi:cyclase